MGTSGELFLFPISDFRREVFFTSIQQEVITIPKSITPERIRENAAVFDFSLSAEDMTHLSALNRNHHYYWDPTNVK
jgi:diketogulonate reductase-like aldo/keto reductase